MRIPVLLACALPNWVGTARLPGALAHAGFAATLLAPRDALATRSRFVERHVLPREGWTRLEWVEGLRAGIDARAPRLVIPGDEAALHLLFAFARTPPAKLPGEEPQALQALVCRSLGDPAHFAALERDLGVVREAGVALERA